MGRLIPAGTGLDHYRNVRLIGEQEEEMAALEAVQIPPAPYEEAERAPDLFRNGPRRTASWAAAGRPSCRHLHPLLAFSLDSRSLQIPCWFR
ncbi:MAG: hypothetical protein ACRD0Y_09710 [Terriglobales bacterium]